MPIVTARLNTEGRKSYGGPRLYRFYSYENILYLPVPSAGWNPDAPWHEVPESQAPKLDNLFIKPGKITTRGQFTALKQDASFAHPCGAVLLRQPAILHQGQFGTLTAADNAGVGTIPWSNPTNVGIADGNAATVTFGGGGGTSHYLEATGFGFSVPIGATIVGVSVSILRGMQVSFTRCTDNVVSLIKGGVVSGSNKASASLWPLDLAYANYGGSSDTWGMTLTPADINASNFGIAISITDVASAVAQVDFIGMTVYFAVGTALAAQTEGIAIAQKAVGAPIIDHVNAPVVKAQTAASLTQGTHSFSWLSPTGTLTTGLTSNPSPGWRWINFDGQMYGLSYDGYNGTTNETATDAATSYFAAKTKLMTVTAATGTPVFSTMLNAPQGAFDLEAWQSRIWLIGGIDTPGGGTTHSATTIFFSNPIVAGGGNAAAGADWKDPVEGTTNQIKMDNDADDPGVGLAAAKNGLVVFRRNSIHVIRGSTSANYTVTQVSDDVGCIDARSIVKTDAGIYFISHLGCMVTDGATVRNVSGPVMNTLQRAITEQQNGIFNLQGGYAMCALTPDSNILISIGTYDATGNTVPIWCALYDRASNSWIRITSSIWNDNTTLADNLYPGPVLSSADLRTVYALSNQRVTRLDGISYNAPQALYDLNASGVYVPIPAVWQTTPLVTGQSAGGWRSRTNAQMKRYFADYVLAAPDLEADVAWSIVPVAADSSPYDVTRFLTQAADLTDSSVSTIGSTVKTAKTRVQREAFDCVQEVVDMAFVFTLYAPDVSPVPPNTVVAELYGVGAEHQKTRDLR